MNTTNITLQCHACLFFIMTMFTDFTAFVCGELPEPTEGLEITSDRHFVRPDLT